jgi:serine/threonine protein kinase
MGGGQAKQTSKIQDGSLGNVNFGSIAEFFQKFALQAELGSGAYSIVKLATNKKTKEKVAVKIVKVVDLSKEDKLSLGTEIEILKELKHPNIITLYETYRSDDDVYIVTELVQGGELFDRIVNTISILVAFSHGLSLTPFYLY